MAPSGLLHNQTTKIVDNNSPASTAAANKSVAGTPTTGSSTVNMTEGGIRMPTVPLAAMAPAFSFASQLLLVINGAAVTPSSVTDELCRYITCAPCKGA